MYIHINNFDYDDLLTKIIYSYDLKDQDVAYIDLYKIFKAIADKFNNDLDLENNPFKKQLLNDFLEYIDIGFGDYNSNKSPETFSDLVESVTQFSLNRLHHAVSAIVINNDDIDKSTINAIAEDAIDVYGGIFLEGDPEELVDKIVDAVKVDIKKYRPNNFDECQIAVMAFIEEQLLANEKLIGIDVKDFPGHKVMYGDTLITFPIITIRVLENG